MQQIPKSGYYCANKFARLTLDAYEEVMGKHGLKSILNMAGMGALVDNPPPDDLQREFDFADLTGLHVGLEEMVGARGGRGLALRAGREIFSNSLKNYGTLAGFGDPAFKDLPLQTRLRIGLPAAARVFSQITDQIITVTDAGSTFCWTIQRCPICWTRSQADKPVCHFQTGLLQGLLNWISGGLEFRVQETRCCALGESLCEFEIQKQPMD